jgi:hypothetical protein
MSVTLPPSGNGRAVTRCRGEDGPLVEKVNKLGIVEVEGLRRVLAEARAFEGQFWGRDLRGLDFAFITLHVDDGERAAVLVCSLNDSFQEGARKHLLEALRAIEARTSGGP